MQLTEKDIDDIKELLDWLSRCPSRHRHLLGCFGFKFYKDLCDVEVAANSLAEKLEIAAKGHGFVRKIQG